MATSTRAQTVVVELAAVLIGDRAPSPVRGRRAPQRALDALLALAREPRGHTIEAVMARDDAEFGVEHLLDQLRGPHPER